MKTFKRTCDKPYDRHFYVVRRPNGKPCTFDDYELLRAWWFQQMDTKEYVVDVLDKVQHNNTKKGFG